MPAVCQGVTQYCGTCQAMGQADGQAPGQAESFHIVTPYFCAQNHQPSAEGIRNLSCSFSSVGSRRRRRKRDTGMVLHPEPSGCRPHSRCHKDIRFGRNAMLARPHRPVLDPCLWQSGVCLCLPVHRNSTDRAQHEFRAQRCPRMALEKQWQKRLQREEERACGTPFVRTFSRAPAGFTVSGLRFRA